MRSCLPRLSRVTLLAAALALWATSTGLQAAQAVAPNAQQTLGRSPAQPAQVLRLPKHVPLRSEAELVALQQEELRLARRLLQDFPSQAESHSMMANVLYRHGKENEALTFLRQAQEIDPKRSDIYLRMAQLSMERGELEQGIKHYEQALALQPGLPNAYSNVGNMLMMLGRYDEAIAALKKELQVSPRSSFAYFLLGQAYTHLRQYDLARENYARAVELKPDYVNAYYGLVTVCTRMGQKEQAQVHLETFKRLKAAERKNQMTGKRQYDDLLESQKDAAVTFASIGGAYRRQGELSKAEAVLKRAAGLDPNNVVCYLELASLYQQQGRLPEAVALHRRITEIRQHSPLSYLMIGILSAHLRQYDAAEKALQQMIKLVPRKSDGYRELARLYLKTAKHTALALKLAQRAVTLQPIASNQFVLGWAYHANGDPARARAFVKQALEQEPDNPSYQRLYKTLLQTP